MEQTTGPRGGDALLELNPGLHHMFTRSFHQGIGSPKDRRTYNDSGDDS